MAGEIRFRPSEDDYAGANRDWFLATLARPKVWIRTGLFMLLLAGLGAFLAHLDGNPDEIAATAVGYALLALALCLLIYLSVFLTLPRRCRRLHRQNKAVQQDWTYRWSEAGLDIETGKGRTFYPWPDFHRWHVGRNAVLLFLNDQLFFYLPRRLIDDAAAEDIASLPRAAGVPRL